MAIWLITSVNGAGTKTLCGALNHAIHTRTSCTVVEESRLFNFMLGEAASPLHRQVS